MCGAVALQATQADGLCLGLPVVQPEHEDRAKAGTMVQDRPTRPFDDPLVFILQSV